MTRKHFKICTVAVLGLCITLPLRALDLGLTVGNESEYTTNSGSTDTDEVEEWQHRPSVNMRANHAGSALEFDADVTITRELYQQDLFDDETTSTGSANLLWHAIPERLDFTANQTRTQSAERAIDPVTPSNRQETTTTTAGPTLIFNPRGSDTLELSYLWGSRESERSDTDAITHNVSLAYQLQLSNINTVTFQISQEQVQFENPFIPDIEYQILQVGIARELNNFSYSLLTGYNSSSRNLGREDVDTFIFEGELDWQFRPTSSMTFSAARELLDQSEQLSSGTFQDDLTFQPNSDLGEVFVNERLGITFEQQLGRRSSLSLGLAFDREDFEDVGRDVERSSVTASYNRRVSPRIQFSAAIDLSEEEFSDESDEADTIRGSLSLDYNIRPRLNAGLSIEYEQRDSDSDLSSRSFDEWAAIISVSYDILSFRQ